MTDQPSHINISALRGEHRKRMFAFLKAKHPALLAEIQRCAEVFGRGEVTLRRDQVRGWENFDAA